MTYSVTRELVERFYQALAKRDFGALETMIGDDIVWTVSGPVDVMPFCGQRNGKAAVMNVIMRQVPAVLPTRDYCADVTLVDGDRAAVMGRLHGTHHTDGRPISYRTTHFMQFKDDKLIEYVSVLDSFDAAEQVLGRRIGGAPSLVPSRMSDIVAV